MNENAKRNRTKQAGKRDPQVYPVATQPHNVYVFSRIRIVLVNATKIRLEC